MRIVVRGTSPCEIASARAAIRAALRPYELHVDTEVTLAFVDDVTMRALNSRHRRRDKTTDVLSFGQALPAGAKGLDAVARLQRDADGALDLGDIVISGAQAARQARRRRVPLAREVAFLAAHGALHLVGFEDETRAGYREMVRLGTDAVSAARSRRRRAVR